MRFLGDLRGFVIADVRIERGDQHEGILHVVIDSLQVRLDAEGAVMSEGAARVGEQSDAMQEVVDDDWFENVEFEIAL